MFRRGSPSPAASTRQTPEPTIDNYRALLARSVVENDHIIYLAAGVVAFNLLLVNKDD